MSESESSVPGAYGDDTRLQPDAENEDPGMHGTVSVGTGPLSPVTLFGTLVRPEWTYPEVSN